MEPRGDQRIGVAYLHIGKITLIRNVIGNILAVQLYGIYVKTDLE